MIFPIMYNFFLVVLILIHALTRLRQLLCLHWKKTICLINAYHQLVFLIVQPLLPLPELKINCLFLTRYTHYFFSFSFNTWYFAYFPSRYNGKFFILFLKRHDLDAIRKKKKNPTAKLVTLKKGLGYTR